MNASPDNNTSSFGRIPEGWEAVSLDDGSHFSLIRPGIEEFVGEREYVSTASIEVNRIVTVESKITFPRRPLRANMQPRISSVWFARMKNTLKVYSFTEENESETRRYVLSTGFAGIECGKAVDPVFLKEVLLWDGFNRLKDKLADGSTQKAISNESIRTITIPLPPHNEQRKIAAILSRVDKMLEKTDQIISRVEELKSGLMQQLLTKGIGHAEFERTEIGDLPEGWKVLPLREFGDVVTGSTPPTHMRKYYGNDCMFVSPADLGQAKFVTKTRKSLSSEGLRMARPIPPNSILVTCISSYDGIGKSGMSTATCATNQQINSIVCRNNVNPNFMFHSIEYHRPRIQTYAVRSGGYFAIITKEVFGRIPMPMPPKQEQDEIARVLSAADDKIIKEKSTRSNLESLKNGLMQALLTGNVRVKVD
jgi:hypothetical protein